MQHDNFDEKDSLQRIEQGDEVAARELLRHFHPFVLKLVRAHLPRRSSEEDLVQMIFIKVFHKLNQYTGRMPLEHWISRIAVNTCLNALKADSSGMAARRFQRRNRRRNREARCHQGGHCDQ